MIALLTANNTFLFPTVYVGLLVILFLYLTIRIGKIAREMIEKRFPAPQITNTKFNAVLDNCKEVVEAQIKTLNALTPTEKTAYEIKSRKKLIKQVITKIDDLTNELILSEPVILKML